MNEILIGLGGKSVNTRKRNLGIELLRIICMMCMIIQHIIGHGWVIQSIHPGTWKCELVIALRSLCLFGISGFALISGYVGVRSRYRYSSVALQWTKVWLYAVLFTLLASVLDPGSVGRKDWTKALFPALNRFYWYFTAYLGCFTIAPIIRKAMRQMTLRQASVCTATLILIFSMLSNALGGDSFYVDVGKGTLWLVVMYAVGAYFGQFQPHARIPKGVLWALAVVSMLVMAGLQPVSERLGFDYLSTDPRNNSIQTVVMAIVMLMLFSRMEIRWGKKLISWLGGASFGVYIIHDHPQIRMLTISRYSYMLTELGNVEIIVGIILAAAAIYVVCALIDSLRQKIYDILGIKQKLELLESKLIGDLWAD